MKTDPYFVPKNRHLFRPKRGGQRLSFWIALAAAAIGCAFLLVWKAGPDLPLLFGVS